jgi:hypothetical protein
MAMEPTGPGFGSEALGQTSDRGRKQKPATSIAHLGGTNRNHAGYCPGIPPPDVLRSTRARLVI